MATSPYGLYADAYPAVQQRYNAAIAAGPAWEGYVVLNGDLQQAWSQAERNKAWGAYVDYHRDLAATWNAFTPAQQAAFNNPATAQGAKGDWGQNHYNTNGAREGRVVPYFYQGTAAGGPTVTSRAEWGQYHYSNFGAREGRRLPYNYDPNNRQGGNGIDLFYNYDEFGFIDWSKVGSRNGSVLPNYSGNATQDSYNVLAVTNPSAATGLAQAPAAGSYSTTDVLIPPRIGIVNGQLTITDPGVNAVLRTKYQNAINAFNASPGGNYKTLIANLAGGNSMTAGERSLFISQAKGVFDNFYLTNKAGQPWDPVALGAQPPTGGFDPEYYRLNTPGGQLAEQEWTNAQTSVQVGTSFFPDLDISAKYTRDTYLQWYYTTQGKAAGDRGNQAEVASLPETYTEFLTDAEYQQYRDQVLGLSPSFTTLAEWSSAQDPAFLQEWYNSLPPEQKAQYDEGTLPIPTLDSIPERLRDQAQIRKGTTLLEGQLSTVIGLKDIEQQKLFGALTQDSLKEAAIELQRQKLNEQQFDFYRGLPGLSEIMTVNETLSNSILGDTGVGGIFGWMGNTGNVQESLEKSLSAATGIPSRNTAVYNWQKWFDEQLVTRYQGGSEIVDPFDPTVTYTLDAQFAQDYIDRYLKPRFDTSRSMTEFVSYMDVKQNEQNVFQTQTALDALRDIADLRSKAYLDNIRAAVPLNFNVDFYWNPEGNFTTDDPKYQKYLQQKDEVAADWEIAKTQGDTAVVPGTDWTWNQWAYYYGLDPNDRSQFAKLHYQVKGASQGFDPAKDVITPKDAEDYIQATIIPELVNEKLNIGDITFLNFITPQEYADQLLEGIDPTQNKEEWDKLLEGLGLTGVETGVAEVKQYIIDAFTTNAAKQIRESIKYLNEKKLKPTQERLGVTYIERPEDEAPIADPNATQLYKIFQGAGYQGTEDEFYNEFMTDINRSEMQLVTQASKGLQTSSLFGGLSSADPFEALVSIEGLFNDESTQTKTTTSASPAPSYFSLFDDTTSQDYKSETGKTILSDFTSIFKGLS